MFLVVAVVSTKEDHVEKANEVDDGENLQLPLLMSLTITVPKVVPSLFHNSNSVGFVVGDEK